MARLGCGGKIEIRSIALATFFKSWLCSFLNFLDLFFYNLYLFMYEKAKESELLFLKEREERMTRANCSFKKRYKNVAKNMILFKFF